MSEFEEQGTRKREDVIDDVAQDPHLKAKRRTTLIAAIVFAVFAAFACFYCVATFQSNIDLMNREDLSVLAIIITLPIFIICGFAELVLGGISFGMALTNIVKYKNKNVVMIIFAVIMALVALYPVFAFVFLINYHPAHSGDSSSMSDVSSCILALSYIL